ncbi:hypothetical protein HGM15179_011339, partial [Zosterops borbonicus]
FPFHSGRLLYGLPRAFSSSDWINPTLSAFLHRRGTQSKEYLGSLLQRFFPGCRKEKYKLQ